jgi:hypothetical protein
MNSFLDHSYVRELMSLDLDVSNFAFIGSTPIFARGWIRSPSDIDVVARKSAWDTALQLGEASIVPDSNVRKVSLFNGNVEIFDGWFPECWSADEMIDGSDIIYGLRFVSLEIISAVKRRLSRPKDLTHLRIISEHTGKGELKSFSPRTISSSVSATDTPGYRKARPSGWRPGIYRPADPPLMTERIEDPAQTPAVLAGHLASKATS